MTAVKITKAIERVFLASNRLRGQRYSRRMKRYPTLTETMLADGLRKRRYWFAQQSSTFDTERLYIADFILKTPSGKLVVEVDGPGHLSQQQYDKRRDEWMKQKRGYQVIRFTSREVFHNLQNVLAVIDQYSPEYK